VKRLTISGRLLIVVLSFSGSAWADVSCEQAVLQLDYTRFLGIDAQCVGHKKDFCNHLANMNPGEFEKLSIRLKADGKMNAPEVFAACGLDFNTIHYRQCQKAFRQENLDFVLDHCPGEAWALARAQCERRPETVSNRYEKLCDRFYKGMAPGPGARSPDD
jgi:hypothetical protein